MSNEWDDPDSLEGGEPESAAMILGSIVVALGWIVSTFAVFVHLIGVGLGFWSIGGGVMLLVAACALGAANAGLFVVLVER